MVGWITRGKGVLVTIMGLEEIAQEKVAGKEEKGKEEMQNRWTPDE